jgi:hypothetical protein
MMIDVLRDVLESDLVIGHFVYGTGVANGGLDADTIYRVLDDVVVERNGVDDIRRTTTNRSNRKTVPARTETVVTDVCKERLTVPELTATQSSWL